ncbi:MAG: hypothetical protein QOJ35_1069 [Solirubrobacteraceae bacterium]|nr:hypothetical protein [Solirubrobacteraceae bacterium]
MSVATLGRPKSHRWRLPSCRRFFDRLTPITKNSIEHRGARVQTTPIPSATTRATACMAALLSLFAHRGSRARAWCGPLAAVNVEQWAVSAHISTRVAARGVVRPRIGGVSQPRGWSALGSRSQSALPRALRRSRIASVRPAQPSARTGHVGTTTPLSAGNGLFPARRQRRRGPGWPTRGVLPAGRCSAQFAPVVRRASRARDCASAHCATSSALWQCEDDKQVRIDDDGQAPRASRSAGASRATSVELDRHARPFQCSSRAGYAAARLRRRCSSSAAPASASTSATAA